MTPDPFTQALERLLDQYFSVAVNGVSTTANQRIWLGPRITKLHQDSVRAIIGEDEDLNAPVNRDVDGNPESDTSPDLYLVRRATRNMHRTELRLRAGLEKDTNES